MGDVTIDPPPAMADHDSGLSIPPIDAAFFSQQYADGGGDGDFAVDDLDFDFSMDDLWIPSSDEMEELLNCTSQGLDSHQFAPIYESGSSDLPQSSLEGAFTVDCSLNCFGAAESDHTRAYQNAASPESNGSNRQIYENCGGSAKAMDSPSPESLGSENYRYRSNNIATMSATSSHNSFNSSRRTGVVNENIKLEESSRGNVNSSKSKRKKDCEDCVNNTEDSRTVKSKKSSCNSENKANNSNDNNGGEDEKRKVRLMRNRESAQISRQRKKQYVEELEDKVKTMHSTIQDLNAKISYLMAENATLRQQMGVSGAMPPPPPPMYPYQGMMHPPWMPYAPPYMMRAQGSQVPVVPIPRLKPQATQVMKTSKKGETKSKKNTEPKPKMKKVAGVSFIGFLVFILLLGGLAPFINMRYGGVGESLTGVVDSYEKNHGRILMVNGTLPVGRRYSGGENRVHCDRGGGVGSSNGSEPLIASLYVPRNDRLVRIDGNLVIHSVLASEKAMSSGGKTSTGLAVVPADFHGDVPVPVPGAGGVGSQHPQYNRALGAGAGKLKATEGSLQQWFREGLAGPMLRSGMCTEVLQFEVSPASPSGAIVPSPTPRNVSGGQNKNSRDISRGRTNRRILRGLPIPLPDYSSLNITAQHGGNRSTTTGKDKLSRNNSSSSPPMVVSILVDPREADVMGTTKPIARIFVVVLIDSVKYVTYSCMLPFKGASAHHLVTAA
ncbi:bZIP transcription factor 17-like [Andrographis paniculata]|uniref:bZIP transcription factor 17-like n=1 Tax=Andrographis paniculata TaxID=175694 RepID=UPI0021E92098|nr:bZIP transcription factor 17-like [Andrographis paniculata]XP_051148654.1 bZIP transcription factor 17-like [Andrographis paniculata]